MASRAALAALSVLVALTLQTQAGQVVEQMRGLSMQLQGLAPGNGILSDAEPACHR